jgi:hypothetical protein
MKVLLIVPDGVAVRNYLYSSFITELEKKEIEVIVYHQISDSAIKEVENVHQNINHIQRIPQFVENPKARILRESLAYARLLRNKKILKNETIMTFWNKNQKGWKQKILYRLAEILGFVFSKSYDIILKLESVYDKEIAKSKVTETIGLDLKKLNPDLVLNLHQRVPISSPIIAAAKKAKIKTATVIFSWDNVPKARLISRYDNYFVWSDIMKTELSLLYPEIKIEQIKVVGTPQFEFYFQKEFQKEKKVFFEEHGLNPNKKTICFSANDQTSPYEPNYFDDICQEINAMEEDKRPQIIFRRNPADKSDRFDAIAEKYRNIVFTINPDWRTEKENTVAFAAIYPAYNDLQLLVNTTLHSDVVINLGSTMAHDFAVNDKPCLYLNYNPVSNTKFDVNDIYKFQHFTSMEGLEAVEWVNSKSEIVIKMRKAIEFPEKTGKDRKAWMQRIVKYPLQENSINIANEVERLHTSV